VKFLGFVLGSHVRVFTGDIYRPFSLQELTDNACSEDESLAGRTGPYLEDTLYLSTALRGLKIVICYA